MNAARIRPLRRDDVHAAFQLSYEAGWNQTQDDWRRLISLEPEGCFCIECDGRVVATTTLLCHQKGLAWIGMVLTHSQYRHLGFARRLVAAALKSAKDRSIPSIKLDATSEGHGIYLRAGFRDEQPVERWRREPSFLRPTSYYISPGEADYELDREAFGGDRRRYLATLGEALCLNDGFVFQRTGSRARFLGPCVARKSQDAANLIQSLVGSQSDETWYWDLMPRQAAAAEMARNLGFAPSRHLIRMGLGKSVAGNDSLVYALGGFESG